MSSFYFSDFQFKDSIFDISIIQLFRHIFNITITHLITTNCKKGLWSVHHEPASVLPDSDDVSGLGRQSEIKFSINNVHAAFTALEGPTCMALIKMIG
mgnify:FL=1